MITATNKVYGFENERAFREWLSEVTTKRGKTIKSEAFNKMITLFKSNRDTFKVKLLKDYKIRFENVNEPIDYLISSGNMEVISPSATLNLYIKNRRDTIIKNYDKNITKIKNEDENLKAFKNAQDVINNLISDKDKKVDLLSSFDIMSKETKDKLNKEKEKRDNALVELSNFYAEVNARIVDNDEPNAILKVYNIIDEDGKLA